MNRLEKWSFVAAALLLTLSACSKSTTTSSTSSTTAVSSSAAATQPSASVRAAGAALFNTNCASCHQANGQGSPGAFPPLAGNPVVTGSAANVIHIVKFGLTGAISVKGAAYNGVMPPWGSTLSNTEIAEVISYVRSSWGNAAGPVSAAAVGSVAK